MKQNISGGSEGLPDSSLGQVSDYPDRQFTLSPPKNATILPSVKHDRRFQILDLPHIIFPYYTTTYSLCSWKSAIK
jgi:hypothetical protein